MSNLVGYIVFLFVDPAMEQFVELGGFAYSTTKELHDMWQMCVIAESNHTSQFQAVLLDANGNEIVHVNAGAVMVETALGHPIAHLIGMGRLRNLAERRHEALTKPGEPVAVRAGGSDA